VRWPGAIRCFGVIERARYSLAEANQGNQVYRNKAADPAVFQCACNKRDSGVGRLALSFGRHTNADTEFAQGASVMTDQEQVARLMAEVGTLDDDIVAVVQTGDDSWAIRFEDVDIEVERDPHGGRLVLSAEIAVPRREDRVTVYEALLSYSMLWRETGGLRMALAEPGGAAVQLVDLNTVDVTPKLLATVAANLAERTLVWRAFLASGQQGEQPTNPLADRGVKI
jgi:hypothetical protein